MKKYTDVDIVAELQKLVDSHVDSYKEGFDIDKRKIHLDTDIKAFGGYHIEVKLYNGITAKLAVSVTEAQ